MRLLFERRSLVNAVLFLLLGLAAVLLPLFLWRFDLTFVDNTYGDQYELFELFGFTAAAALVIGLLTTLRGRAGLVSWAPALLLAFTAFHFLTWFTEYSIRSWDYFCYENAAVALEAGQNPYLDTPETCYLYPPLLAQGLAEVHQFLGAIVPGAGAGSWFVVFYLYQVGQFLLLLLSWFLLYRFARAVNLPSLHAALLVTALFLLNNPLFRTLRHNQVNLWMLALLLAAILCLRRRPWLSGAAVALGIHLKLFAAVLLPVWLLARRWRPVAGSIAFFGLVLLGQTLAGGGWTAWQQFARFYGSQPLARFVRFRNSSLRSIISGSARLLRQWLDLDEQAVAAGVGVTVVLATAAVLAWFAWRFWRREAAFAAGQAVRPAFRLYGHSLDALALVLIAAPVTWEHHFVLAIPLLVWAVAVGGRQRLWLTTLSGFLMLAVPTFDVFPFGYHRLLGLMLWLYVASPLSFPLAPPVIHYGELSREMGSNP